MASIRTHGQHLSPLLFGEAAFDIKHIFVALVDEEAGAALPPYHVPYLTRPGRMNTEGQLDPISVSMHIAARHI